MNNITIKQATQAEISVIECILLDTVKWLDEIGQPLWYAEDMVWSKLSESYRIDDFYIAYSGDSPAGCISLTSHDPFFWPDVKKGEALFIHKLAVTKAARKSGVADMLINFAKAECASRQIPTLRLDCDAMRPKQRAVYERNGFVCVEEKKMGVKRVFKLAMYVYTLPDTKTGWEREHRVHFDEIVVNYDKVRWDYPDELYTDIFEYLGAGRKNALEIGSGTGKATAPMLSAGFDVTAVELGANMAEFSRVKFKNYSGFNVIVSDFENAVLPENSFDLVYAASAFHWVNAEIGCPKVFRLLRKGGVFALLRNNVYTADGDPLYEAIQAAYEKHYFRYYTSKTRWSRHSCDDLKEPTGVLNGFGFEDMRAYGFQDIFMKFYEKNLSYTADEYVALMDTMSDHRELPEENRAALYVGIKEAINKYGGRYSHDTVFTLYMGRKI